MLLWLLLRRSVGELVLPEEASTAHLPFDCSRLSLSLHAYCGKCVLTCVSVSDKLKAVYVCNQLDIVTHELSDASTTMGHAMAAYGSLLQLSSVTTFGSYYIYSLFFHALASLAAHLIRIAHYRRGCSHPGCSCMNFQRSSGASKCYACGHPPASHKVSPQALGAGNDKCTSPTPAADHSTVSEFSGRLLAEGLTAWFKVGESQARQLMQ